MRERERERERERQRDRERQTDRQTENPNRKAKTPHFEDNLVIIKDPKRDACVSVNSMKQDLKRDRHTTL